MSLKQGNSTLRYFSVIKKKHCTHSKTPSSFEMQRRMFTSISNATSNWNTFKFMTICSEVDIILYNHLMIGGSHLMILPGCHIHPQVWPHSLASSHACPHTHLCTDSPKFVQLKYIRISFQTSVSYKVKCLFHFKNMVLIGPLVAIIYGQSELIPSMWIVKRL